VGQAPLHKVDLQCKLRCHRFTSAGLPWAISPATIASSDLIAHFHRRQVAGAMALSSSSLVLASLADVWLDPVGCQEFLGMGILYESAR
jgi:hypothetical protein